MLLPATREVELADGINGLFSFTTDNMPLIGESPDVKGFWVAEAVWVTHSAGVGRAVAELLVDGHCSSFDLHECDINRFEPHQLSPEYVLARDCQNFVEVYDILHPLDPPVNLRPIRTSPVLRPADRARRGSSSRPPAGSGRSGTRRTPAWSPGVTLPAPRRLGGEVLVAHRRAPRRRSPASGRDVRHDRAQAARGHRPRAPPGSCRRLVTGDVDKSVGSITYCLLLDVDGGIRSDVTVARLAADRFQVGANGNLDLDWLRATAAGRRQRPGQGHHRRARAASASGDPGRATSCSR